MDKKKNVEQISNELLEICNNDNRSEQSNWRYWPTELYGIGKWVRKYGFYPEKLPLYVYSDHGVTLRRTQLPEHELNNDAPYMLIHSPDKLKCWKELSSKPAYGLFSPFVFYRRNNKIKLSSDAKGTLAFPGHSSKNIEDMLNPQDYISDLKNLPDKFKPISICLHMHDINKDKHLPYMEAGFEVFTAGHNYDNRFTERFYDILKKFKYTTSNFIGSYTFYSVEMEIPFFLYGAKTKLYNLNNKDMPQGHINEEELYPEYKEANALFRYDRFANIITDEQKKFVEQELGITHGISRLKMSYLLYSAWLKKGGLIKDLIAPIIRRPRLLFQYLGIIRKK